VTMMVITEYEAARALSAAATGRRAVLRG